MCRPRTPRPTPRPASSRKAAQQALLPGQQQPQLQKRRPALMLPQNPSQNQNAGAGPGFFSFFRRPPQQPQVQQPQVAPRPPQPGQPQPIRPPGYINRAASVPPPGIAR